VFGFVNAPLFAVFLLGMFWKRATGHGGFFGLLLGTASAAVFHGLSIPAGEAAGLKGGWIASHWVFASSMAQNFWMAIAAFVGCFVFTVVISLATAPNRSEAQLRGLVYSLTEKPSEEGAAWYKRPAILGSLVLLATVVLNIIFW
jgi:SSS family solute:Na+ symporter